MKKVLGVFIWFILLMVIWTAEGKMLSAPSSVLVILGILVWMAFIAFSFKTKCLTDLPRLTWNTGKKKEES